MTKTRLGIYIAFLVTAAIWMGSGVFESIGSHAAWYSDPVGYTRALTQPAGTINPWPFTTAALGLCTLAALVAVARHRGSGRREALVSLGGVFVILLATGLYFVPNLIKLADHAALADSQIVEMSRTWIRLNLIRMVVLLALYVYGLVGLVRLSQPADRSA